MNEELQVTLNDALVGIITDVTATKDFIVSEAPEVIEQLLTWNMCISLAFFVVWLLVISVFVFYLVRGIRNHWDGDGIMALMFGSVLSLLGVVGSTSWLQILIAPKLYLLEYAASLVK